MKVFVTTILNVQASTAWQIVKQSSTLVYVTKGMLGFQGAESFPIEWQAGDTINTRLLVLSLLPAWRHRIRFVQVKDNTLITEESGGLIKQWDHLIHITPIAKNKSQYTDIVDIKAGVFTPFIFLFAHLFYRYRQHRWKRLIRRYTKNNILLADRSRGDRA